VDRRFNRTRFDAVAVVQRFARSSRDLTDLRVVESELRSAVDRTLQPAAAGLWLRQR
jgi:hypothetical protein